MSASDEFRSTPDSDFEDGAEVDAEARWKRFLLASLAFLAYETVFLLMFQSDFDWSASTWEGPLFGVLILGAAVGYLLYGIWAGSLASIMVICLPVVIALGLHGTAVSIDQTGEAWPLYVVWIYFSVIFLMAWLVGSFTGYSVRKKRWDRQ